MNNHKLLLLGGGGHCKSVIDSLLTSESYTEIGIIDNKRNIGKSICNIPIIGCDDDLVELYQKGYTRAFVTVGSVGDPSIRLRLFRKLEQIGFETCNIIDKTAIISPHIKMANGIFVGKNAVINAGTTIGKGAIINSSVTIEHDCIIEDFVHIASGSVLCGEVKVGKYAHVGAKSVVKQQVKIGMNSIIGIGSVVLHDIPENVVAFGNPCKEERIR